MSNYTRGDFLKTTGGIAGAASLGGLALGYGQKKQAAKGEWKGFKYSMYNESMRELPWEEQYSIIGNAGYIRKRMSSTHWQKRSILSSASIIRPST
ncbi:MAG: hypothetical protein GWP06_04415 [Actinobacteria bacterium]|nr:hypothetical protein [Actinomycetota bacterium]